MPLTSGEGDTSATALHRPQGLTLEQQESLKLLNRNSQSPASAVLSRYSQWQNKRQSQLHSHQNEEMESMPPIKNSTTPLHQGQAKRSAEKVERKIRISMAGYLLQKMNENMNRNNKKKVNNFVISNAEMVQQIYR